LFPKNPSGDSYEELYEEVAAKHYSIESVFGTPAPKPQPSFQRNRNAGIGTRPPVVVERVKHRTFTRPGDTVPTSTRGGDTITAETLFKPRP
jgi:hypothetical protein